ncbi:TBC1 domain family member 20-like [Platysternon megacephalum]|uniref:TBC1 domain family member 20-like n=1 Tax=Platysternon megacephalum TaxID=55544 RepID=A0A4D9DTJ0_9SAUR|nr:TBC1 domain family member 20-like [Platysternon megacephalum]
MRVKLGLFGQPVSAWEQMFPTAECGYSVYCQFPTQGPMFYRVTLFTCKMVEVGTWMMVQFRTLQNWSTISRHAEEQQLPSLQQLVSCYPCTRASTSSYCLPSPRRQEAARFPV